MTSTLAAALARLNSEQRDAIDSPDSTVVLAGPGSGKTDTIVLKVTRLLQRDVSPPRGVACLTYGNDAVREFTQRLRNNGIRADHRLFLGTTHSFCMQRVLRPFADLCGRPDLVDPRLLSAAEQLHARQVALDQCRVSDQDPRWFDPTLTTIRRAIACDEDLSGFDDRHVATANAYNSILAGTHSVDFEAMTLGALQLLETHVDLRDLIVARYPWIAIDEYQDLGGPLHRIVLALHDAGANIFAVGDPDQCIFGFTGANPVYLNQLADHPEFASITLRFNYRSGSQLIALAQATLDEPRDYSADPSRQDPGLIEITGVNGGLSGQARRIVDEIIPGLIAAGTRPEQIAILYNRKGLILDAIIDAIGSAADEYLVEKDIRFPSGPVVRWLQECATRALNPDDAIALGDLVAQFPAHDYQAADPDTDLPFRQRLLAALGHAVPTQPLDEWIVDLDQCLQLTCQLQGTGVNDDDVDILSMLARPTDPPIQLADFARGVHVDGRVVVTTCHSAKGRQFDVVIMPGLQRTLFPFERWIAGSYHPTDLVGDRRLFYVGITRARHQVHLLYSDAFENPWGRSVSGWSPFLDELEQRLDGSP